MFLAVAFCHQLPGGYGHTWTFFGLFLPGSMVIEAMINRLPYADWLVAWLVSHSPHHRGCLCLGGRGDLRARHFGARPACCCGHGCGSLWLLTRRLIVIAVTAAALLMPLLMMLLLIVWKPFHCHTFLWTCCNLCHGRSHT